MRSLVYVIAAIAAVGLAIGIAKYPSGDSGSSDSSVASATTVAAEAGDVTLAVPEMHCQFSCFPRVKETLEGSPVVESVELAPQASETALDNRQVIVHYKPGFNADAALQKLADEGFTDSMVVQ